MLKIASATAQASAATPLASKHGLLFAASLEHDWGLQQLRAATQMIAAATLFC